MRTDLQTGLKPREPRTAVRVPSRMRVGEVWSDICIRNVSSKGLMASSDSVPAAGAYVEIRRGTLIVIGRVVWRAGGSFGLRAQDRIDIDALLNEPRLSARPAKTEAGGDRRSTPRAPDIGRRLDRSRQIAAAIQFGAIGGLGMGASAIVAFGVHHVLAAPLSLIESAMG